MCRKRGIMAESSMGENIVKLFGQVFSRFSLDAFAEELNDPENKEDNEDGGAKGTSTTINYEDLIAKARQEEKKKQYKTIEKLKAEKETLIQQHNTDLLEKAELEKKLKEAETLVSKAGKNDPEAVTALRTEIANLTTANKTLEAKVTELESKKPVSREEVEREVREELQAEYEVRAYKAEKLAELKDDILVPELVMGSTKEEIDATITSALERSKTIKESLGVSGDKKKRTPKSPTNPTVEGIQDKKYSLDYLASLDPASKEYLEVRKNLGLR